MIYKNYFTETEKGYQSSPFCMGEEEDFFDDKDDAIREIISFHCDGKYVYSHTLAITEYGECYIWDLEEQAVAKYEDDKIEVEAERDHCNSYSVEMRNR